MFQNETSLKSETDNNNVINDFEISKSFTISTVNKDFFKELSLIITSKLYYSFIKKLQLIFSFSQHRF